MDVGELEEIVGLYKQIHLPPDSPWTQLENAIGAVFSSWNNPRAQTYRRLNDTPDSIGTAVIIQAMVFGNMGQNSGSGIAFIRNPSTGEKEFFGEYLMNAEGEDIASSRRTPTKPGRIQGRIPDPLQPAFSTAKNPGGTLPGHAGSGIHHPGKCLYLL